jgi:hypothetical protein
MEANIPHLLEAKIIEHLFSPWSQRTKFIPKKDGDLRMVHVYCPINAVMIPNAYLMKRIEPVLSNLLQSGLSVYFQADAANGYWAEPLVPEHPYKTAFDTHMGLSHYLRMVQGLAGAPQTYTRLKEISAGPIPGPIQHRCWITRIFQVLLRPSWMTIMALTGHLRTNSDSYQSTSFQNSCAAG